MLCTVGVRNNSSTLAVCGAGIMLRSYSWAELLGSAPWLLGSFGTVSLDIVIFLQVVIPLGALAWPGCSGHGEAVVPSVTSSPCLCL